MNEKQALKLISRLQDDDLDEHEIKALVCYVEHNPNILAKLERQLKIGQYLRAHKDFFAREHDLSEAQTDQQCEGKQDANNKKPRGKQNHDLPSVIAMAATLAILDRAEQYEHVQIAQNLEISASITNFLLHDKNKIG